MSFYSRAMIRRVREQADQPASHAIPMSAIPADAPADDAAITVWSGERWLAYHRWLAAAACVRDQETERPDSTLTEGARCVFGDCKGLRVWLVRDGDRWLIFPGSRKRRVRRRDFASPFLAHAIRTAEQWYGAPASGWCVEKDRE